MKRLLLSLAAGASLWAAPPPEAPLSLDQALDLALRRSRAAELARLQVVEADAGADAARRLRYPQVSASGIGAYLVDPLQVKVGQGSLTSVLDQAGADAGLAAIASALGSFPETDLTLARGERVPVIGALTVTQPLSQLWRIGAGLRAANAHQSEARRQEDRATAQIRFSVEELFVGVLLQQKRVEEKRAFVAYQERLLKDAENAEHVGEALDESVLGQRAAVLEAKSELTRARQEAARLSLQLADLIGRPGDESLAVAGDLPDRPPNTLDAWIAQAADNPDRQVAAATVERASAGVRAARQARVPDLSLFASGYAQDGIPLVPDRSAAVGLALSWDVFDFGRKDAAIAQAVAVRRSAEVDRDRLEEEAARQIRLAYQDYVYAGDLIDLANQALEFRRRAAQLSRQSVANGLELTTAALEAEAQLRRAEADLAAARSQRHLALLRLYLLAGKL